jgi:hypothetical protein
MSLENKVEDYDVVKSGPQGEYEHRERIVENAGMARRQIVDRIVQFIWLMASILEALLGLRFVLKLIAANPASPFAQLIYNFTGLFMWPFANLTSSPRAGGMVLETPVLIAMLTYALLAWALVSLAGILLSRTNSRNVTVYERRRE